MLASNNPTSPRSSCGLFPMRDFHIWHSVNQACHCMWVIIRPLLRRCTLAELKQQWTDACTPPSVWLLLWTWLTDIIYRSGIWLAPSPGVVCSDHCQTCIIRVEAEYKLWSDLHCIISNTTSSWYFENTMVINCLAIRTLWCLIIIPSISLLLTVHRTLIS